MFVKSFALVLAKYEELLSLPSDPNLETLTCNAEKSFFFLFWLVKDSHLVFSLLSILITLEVRAGRQASNKPSERATSSLRSGTNQSDFFSLVSVFMVLN